MHRTLLLKLVFIFHENYDSIKVSLKKKLYYMVVLKKRFTTAVILVLKGEKHFIGIIK